MKLIDRFEIHHSLCYDFLCSLSRLPHNKTFMPEEQPNQEIFKILEDAQEQVTPEIQKKLDIFCDLDTSYVMMTSGFVVQWQVTEVPEFLARLKEVPVEEILRLFLYGGIGPGQEITPSLVKELIANQPQAFQFINENITYSAEDKWQFLQFLTNPEQMKEDLLTLFQWHYDQIFRHQEDFLKDFLAKHEQDLADRLKKYGEEYINLLLPLDYNKHKSAEKITLALSCFYERGSMFDMLHDLYIFGYRYHEKIEGSHSVLAATQVFKAMADETRLNIIKLLSDGPQYGHELAQRLNVSNSTISHHVTTLVLNGLLSSYRQDNRVYFELDVERLKKTMLEAIDKVVGGHQEAPETTDY